MSTFLLLLSYTLTVHNLFILAPKITKPLEFHYIYKYKHIQNFFKSLSHSQILESTSLRNNRPYLYIFFPSCPSYKLTAIACEIVNTSVTQPVAQTGSFTVRALQLAKPNLVLLSCKWERNRKGHPSYMLWMLKMTNKFQALDNRGRTADWKPERCLEQWVCIVTGLG